MIIRRSRRSMITMPAMMLIMVALALAVSSALPLPTATAAGRIAVSHDGRTWAPSLTSPVFDQTGRWVPGDVEQASFWVRNDATDPGDLTITATADPNELIRPGDIELSARTRAGTWAALPLDTPLALADLLRPGQPLRVFVRAHFLFSSGNHSQDELSRLNFLLTLTQSPTTAPTSPTSPTSPSSPGGPGGPVGQGGLPNTGSDFPAWLLPLGAIASGTGAALLRRRRGAKGERR